MDQCSRPPPQNAAPQTCNILARSACNDVCIISHAVSVPACVQVLTRLDLLLPALLDALQAPSERVTVEALSVLASIAADEAHFQPLMQQLLDRCLSPPACLHAMGRHARTSSKHRWCLHFSPPHGAHLPRRKRLAT